MTSFSAQRVLPDLTGTTVKLSFEGTYYNWPIAKASLNNCTIKQYRYKESPNGSFSEWAAITSGSTWSDGNFSFSQNISGTFAVDKTYLFELQINDQLAPITAQCSVSTITPTVDIDTDKRLVSFGMIGSVSGSGVQSVAYYDKYGVPVCPPGMSFEWNSDTIPFGYLPEDGSAVRINLYPGLYAAIHRTFGNGNGLPDTNEEATFNLPNSQGKVSVSKSSSGTFATLGAGSTNALGEETHTLTSNEGDVHSHNTIYCYLGQTLAPNYGAGSTGYAGVTVNSGNSSMPYVTSPAGGGAAHNNLQPSIVKRKIIKY